MFLSSSLHVLNPFSGSQAYDVPKSKLSKSNLPLGRESRSVVCWSLLLNVLMLMLLSRWLGFKRLLLFSDLKCDVMKNWGKEAEVHQGTLPHCSRCLLILRWRWVSLKLEKCIKCRQRQHEIHFISLTAWIQAYGPRIRTWQSQLCPKWTLKS